VKIVVMGGTGLVGSKVVADLQTRGHDAVAASPSTGVDAVTGEGLKEVLDGAQVVVDLLNSPSFADGPVLDFFRTTTANLLAAEAVTGVGHHVAVSIVGADGLPDSGYLRAKVAQEELIEQGSTPYTIIRSTQFFEFLRPTADSATEGSVVRVPAAKFQPIAASDVAQFVSETALDEPVNGRIEIAGPDAIGLDVLIRTVLAADGDVRSVVTDPHARYFGTELTDTSLVPHGSARLGGTTFADWLSAHPGNAVR
jgi:uncharacterized protein YbjT (DUF2867 family)